MMKTAKHNLITVLAILCMCTVYHYAIGGEKMKQDIKKTDAEWKKVLTPEQFRVTRKKGTERAFTGKYYKHKETGMYHCVCCGAELFSSEKKYDSGCGWPSFWDAEEKGSIEETIDRSHGMIRTEITCSDCGAHLGHIFPDGPKPTGNRYCVNSASLNFKPAAKPETTGEEKATFGAGCFWCTEAVYERIEGIKAVIPGYMGGETDNPTYKEICTGRTGHAEVAQVTFDPEKISYKELLDWFWKMHDPTTLNRQGADRGTQYRSAIFYHSEKQKKTAEESMKKHNKSKFRGKIVTEITKATEFYPAENYHQDYYDNNSTAPYCRAVIAPKLNKLKLNKIKR